MTMRTIPLTLFTALLGIPSLALASPPCPQLVTDAALKAQPASKVTACKAEKTQGKVEYEVRLTTKDGRKLEIDISAEGAVLLTEEPISLNAVPRAVIDALKAAHADAVAKGAEKQTKADGTVSYEVAYADGKGKHEATFTPDGKLLEEEARSEQLQ